MPRSTIEVGSRVAYSARFLRSTGQHTGRAPALRGTVRALDPFGDGSMAQVDWHDGTGGRVLVPNLTLTSRIGIDAALADQVQ